MAFGLTASAFRHAPLRGCPRRVGASASRFGVAARRVGSSAFRFGDCCSAGWPSGSPLPLFGMRRFGVALGELVLPPSASEIAAGWVGLRAHRFRFSARTASELPLGELVLPPSASAFAARRVGSSAFRFGVCRSAGWPSGSRLPLFGTHRFGIATRRVSASAFRFRVAAGRVGLRAHGFRFSARTASGLPSASWFFCSAGWPSGSRLPLFGTHRFGDCRSAGWPSGSRLPLFGMRRSAPPRRRREGRRSTPTRHLFHFKTLIPTC